MSLRSGARYLSPAYDFRAFSNILSTTATRPARRPSSSSLCWRCLAHRTRPSRRHLSTATEYKPYTLDPTPPPPRNSDIPDTSIAGPDHRINDTRILNQIPDEGIGAATLSSPRPNISIPESEAQRSRPPSTPPNPSTTQNPPKRQSKLRPRKAAMSLTPTATTQLRALLDQPEPKLIRVGVKNRGCSGLAYHLEYVDQQGKFDEAVEQDGVKVLVDSKALFSIIGSEMDWVEDKLEQRFVFRNPNIKEQCGCGESFMV